MIRDTFVMRDGKVVPKRLARPLVRKDRDGPAVIGDAMPATKHMGTGRIHDSKAKFRADTRAMGCDEVGTDKSIMRERPRYEPRMSEIVQDIKKSMEQLRSR